MSRLSLLSYRLLAYVPLAVSRIIFQGLLYFIYWIFPGRRRVAIKNIEACFPDHNPTQKQKLLRRHYRALGRAVADIGYSTWRSPQALLGRTEIHGLEAVVKKYQQGRSLIILSPHLVDVFISAQILAQFLPLTVMYKAPRDKAVDRAYRQAAGQSIEGRQWQDSLLAIDRNRHAIELIEHRGTLRPVLRTLKNHGVFFYLPDQDLGRRHAVFAPFFSHLVATVTAVSRFATIGQADVVFCSIYQTLKPGFRMRLRILTDFPLTDEQAVGRRINEETERAILEDPAQYFWLHRRFKTRPVGEEPFYS